MQAKSVMLAMLHHRTHLILQDTANCSPSNNPNLHLQVIPRNARMQVINDIFTLMPAVEHGFLPYRHGADACTHPSVLQDLHFVSAPHTLPLQHGQTVPMRAWWRHWNIGTEEPAGQQQQQTGGDASNANSSSSACKAADADRPRGHEQLATAASQEASPFAQRPASASQQQQQEEEELPAPLVQQLQHQPSLLHGQARQEEITSMMASGWEAVVLRDWSTSLQHLTDVWTSAVQDFDGVLGFSNGAAAAFLFAAHAAAHLDVFGSLRFVALAGGYVPEPLEKLLHPSLLAANSTPGSANSNACSSSSNSAQPVSRLKAPLSFPSLHMMGSNDPLIDLDVATQLMDCFQPHSRWVAEHVVPVAFIAPGV